MQQGNNKKLFTVCVRWVIIENFGCNNAYLFRKGFRGVKKFCFCSKQQDTCQISGCNMTTFPLRAIYYSQETTKMTNC